MIFNPPNMTAGDFPLGRKLNGLGNGWIVRADLNLAATLGNIFVLPGATHGLVITRLSLDAGAAATLAYGYAAGLTTPSAVTPINLNSNGATLAAFTAQSNTAPVTGAVIMTAIDIPAAQAYPPVYMEDNPIILPAGSIQGFFLGLNNVLTGRLRVGMWVQEYPY